MIRKRKREMIYIKLGKTGFFFKVSVIKGIILMT